MFGGMSRYRSCCARNLTYYLPLLPMKDLTILRLYFNTIIYSLQSFSIRNCGFEGFAVDFLVLVCFDWCYAVFWDCEVCFSCALGLISSDEVVFCVTRVWVIILICFWRLSVFFGVQVCFLCTYGSISSDEVVFGVTTAELEATNPYKAIIAWF